MNGALSTARAPAPPPSGASAATATGYAFRLRALLAARSQPIAAFVALVVALDATRAWSVGDLEWGPPLAHALLLAGAAALGPQLAEATRLAGRARAALAVVATFGCVGLVAWTAWAAGGTGYPAALRHIGAAATDAFAARSWWFFSVAGLLFAAWCASRERERAALLALREAEVARGEDERALLASRLDVLQARVEPAFFFGALARVREAYASDPARAAGLLDDLIAYLRAALPRTPGGASTVAREATLAARYLDVALPRRAAHVRVDVDDDVADEPFPPMILLPIAQACADGGVDAIAIAGRRDGRARGVAFVLAPGEAGGPTAGALEALRERCVPLLGPAVELALEARGGERRVSLGWRR